MAGNEAKDRASISHDAQNHKPIPTKHQEPRGGGTAEQRQKAPNTERKETRQANPTPPPGMKGGVEEGGRAGMEVGLIETQITVNNEPRSLARMQTVSSERPCPVNNDAPPRLARTCGRRALVRPRSSPEAPEGGGGSQSKRLKGVPPPPAARVARSPASTLATMPSGHGRSSTSST